MEDEKKILTQPPEQVRRDPPELLERAQQAGAAWRRLLLHLRARTPRALGRLLLVGGGIGLLLWLLATAWEALVPFLVGALLAYAVLPFVNGLDRLMPRRLAALLAMLTVFSILGLFIVSLVPALARQFLRLMDILPAVEDIRAWLDQVDVSLETLPETVREPVRDTLREVAVTLRVGIDDFYRTLPQLMIDATLRVVNVIGAVLGLLLLPVWLLTVLTDQRQGIQALNRILPPSVQGDFWAVLGILDRSFRSFFQQQVKQGILVGLGAFVTTVALVQLELLQVEFPLVTAMFVGMMELVPEIGPTVAVVTLAVSGFSISPLYAVVGPGIYLLLHGIVGTFMAGRTARRVREIHPAIMVIVAIAFSQLGLAWVLLSVPIATSLRDLFRYAYGRLDEPPRPAGLLPDQDLLSPAPPVAARRVPLVYRRGRAARVSSSRESSS